MLSLFNIFSWLYRTEGLLLHFAAIGWNFKKMENFKTILKLPDSQIMVWIYIKLTVWALYSLMTIMRNTSVQLWSNVSRLVGSLENTHHLALNMVCCCASKCMYLYLDVAVIKHVASIVLGSLNIAFWQSLLVWCYCHNSCQAIEELCSHKAVRFNEINSCFGFFFLLHLKPEQNLIRG